MATLKRIARMNRIYIGGHLSGLESLLRDFHARQDSTGYWLPLHLESRLRQAIAAEPAYQANRKRERDAWEAAKAVIPADYRTRHGSMLGGDVVINGERISEPSLDTRNLPWNRVGSLETRCRDLTGQSLVNGRVMDQQVLYSAIIADGRTIYRVSHSAQFGDDLRETYYLPPDLWENLILSEVQMRKITPESAQEWLAQYRGCVGTELYEFAATLQPAPKEIA